MKKDFVEYWDQVIRIWLEKDSNYYGESVSEKKPYKYLYNKAINIEKDQLPWFKNHIISNYLHPIHMPEPYWGNPGNCSIVIVNFNPAGGGDMNPHTYLGCLNCQKCNSNDDINTIINYVKKNDYSSLALSFPIWDDVLPKPMQWLESYSGRSWWLKKKQWVNHLIEGKSEKKPFVMELCGWHSLNWPKIEEVISKDKDLVDTIIKHSITPMINAIKNSDMKLGVCIGKQFNDLLPQLIKNSTIKIKFEIVLNCIGKVMINNKNNKMQERTRYYNVYKVDGVYLLNTWVVGSNIHPSAEFANIENLLLKILKIK